LGEIATPVAAAALREFLPEVPSGVKAAAADAALVCAGRLKSEGDIAAAKALLESLLATEPTSHIRAAAARLNA
jgi:HEAT repeat protein